MKTDDAWAHLSTLCKSDKDFEVLSFVRDENYKFWQQAQHLASAAKRAKARAKRSQRTKPEEDLNEKLQ